MSEWITDCKPEHGDGWDGYVWRFELDKIRRIVRWKDVQLGEPWMPITPPEPYVKSKRWTVRWMLNQKCWGLHSNGQCVDLLNSLDTILPSHEQAAERIAAIYEEVMP